MKIRIGLTQRMQVMPGSGEKRDALAHDWYGFLRTVGVDWVALPNHRETALRLSDDLELTGVVLTGGDDIGVFPERDDTEFALIERFRARGMPILGVCRGFQVLHHFFGGRLIPVEPALHVAARHTVRHADGSVRDVNSFHNFSPDYSGLPDEYPLREQAICQKDGTVEMSAGDGIVGIMWHPEREPEPDLFDTELFKTHLGV